MSAAKDANTEYKKTKCLNERFRVDFWNKKEVKCKIKIKKTKPTPRSITQRNPV